MKKIFNLTVLAICLIMLFVYGAEASNSSSLDQLGSQERLLEKADPTIPRNTYRVVQKRAVDLNTRFEFSLQTSMINGGDSYYSTNGVGAHLEFHINPRWSLGFRHQWFFNELTAEGERIFDRAEAQQIANPGDPSNDRVPLLDYPISQTIGSISFYPLYGKMSLFDSGVSYFDMYIMAGGGQMRLESGSTGLATGGVGVGMWWTQHFATRFEVRYQQYTDKAKIDGRQVGDSIAVFGLGFLI